MEDAVVKRMVKSLVVSGLVAGVLLAPAAVSAQVFGTFSWQMQPYCNRVTITLTTAAPGFTLAGSDDQCGAGTRGSVTGVGQFNPNGTVGLSFTIVTSPAAQPVHVAALVNPTNGQGTWSDSLGNHGPFAFFGAQAGLPSRPDPTVPAEVAESSAPASDPCLAMEPPTMTLCGSSAKRWTSTALNYSPLKAWRDAGGQVHLSGSVGVTVGGVGGMVFVLPPHLRPSSYLYLPLATGAAAGASATGAALLLIVPRDAPGTPGAVFVYNPSIGSHNSIHLGDLTFRTDE
jgi:hypothetical protein